MKRRKLFILTGLLLLISLWGSAISAQDGITWRGEYYNNPYLLGESQDIETNAISFDWGTGSPAAGINVDDFSVRWFGRGFLSAGTYRFFVRADDEIRLSVDNNIIIDTFGQSQVGTVLSADVALNSSTHSFQVDYRERSGDAYVFVTWENATTNPTIPNFQPVQQITTTEVDIPLWTVQYYGNSTLAGLPTAIVSENEVSKNWGTEAPFVSIPVNNFSARWTTSVALNNNTYRITARADDGIRVWIDGQLQIDNWLDSEGDVATKDLALSAGLHTIVVEYYEETGNAYIEFSLATLTQTNFTPTPVPAGSVTSAGTTGGVPVDTGARGTVDAFRLNVRANPTTDADIVTKVERGETHPIVGRNEDNSWWQLNVNGTIGWVFSDFIISSNTGNVPVTSSSSLGVPVQTTGFIATATATVNLRSRPTTAGAVLGQFPRGATAEITGRNSTGTWIQVYYDGKLAWVSRSFISTTVATSSLPIAQ